MLTWHDKFDKLYVFTYASRCKNEFYYKRLTSNLNFRKLGIITCYNHNFTPTARNLTRQYLVLNLCLWLCKALFSKRSNFTGSRPWIYLICLAEFQNGNNEPCWIKKTWIKCDIWIKCIICILLNKTCAQSIRMMIECEYDHTRWPQSALFSKWIYQKGFWISWEHMTSNDMTWACLSVIRIHEIFDRLFLLYRLLYYYSISIQF